MVDGPSHAPAEYLDEVLHESRNIVPAFAEWWQLNGKDVEPVIQVAAEFVPRYHSFDITVCGSDETNVYLMTLAAPQTFELLFLQDAQQFGLQRKRDVTHFVKEQRPFMGQFEASDLLRNSAGEGAFLVAEQFAFQEVGRDCSTIQLYEGAFVARAHIVNRLSNQFFANACFPQDQHRGVSRRNQLN